MNKHHTLDCKNKLSEKLLKIGIYYDPKIDPMPKVHSRHLGGDVSYAVEVGCLTVVVNETRANMAKEMLQEYEQEIRSVRKPKKPTKVNGSTLVSESRTPFTDLQKELDEGMGLVGGVMAIWFVVLLGVGYFLLKHFS